MAFCDDKIFHQLFKACINSTTAEPNWMRGDGGWFWKVAERGIVLGDGFGGRV